MNMKKASYLLLCCLPFLAGCSEEKKAMPGEKYSIFVVEKTDQTLQTRYPTTLRGRQTVEVRPQVSGTITDILINEGDEVRRGQVLFVIDQVPYRAALETALANVKSAEAQLRTAKLTAESKEALYREQVISDFDLQTARNQQLEAEAAVAQAKAAVTNARNNLSYTEVKSPVDGVASMIPYRVGALVSSSIAEPLVTVSDDSEVYAYFSMAENQILDLIQEHGSLQKACASMPPVSLFMNNGNEYTEKGRIDAISGTVDESTGSVRLRAVFPNAGHLLRNGGSGSVSVPTVHKNCIAIPQSATYELQNRIFAWKVVDGKTKSTPLTVYKYNDGKTYIVTSGLAVGDIVVAEGAGLLREGIAVDTSSASKTSTKTSTQK